MNENLYYEVNVTLSHEIKEAYEHAVENNIPFYRCVASNGTLFGWDNEGSGKYIRAQEGQEWFVNPEYKELENETEIIEEVSEPASENKEIIKEFGAEEKTEGINDVVCDDENDISDKEIEPEELDYEFLYKELIERYNNLQAKYSFISSELECIRTAISILTKEFKEAIDKLGE